MHSLFYTLLGLLLVALAGRADTTPSTNLPANIVRVPVKLGQCIALHPTKPVLYVGRSDLPADGKGFAVLRLDQAGGIIPDSRVDVADGIVDSPPPLGEGLQYAITSIVVNPVLPQIHIAATAKRPRSFWQDARACPISSLELDEDGVPKARVEGYRNTARNADIRHLACDPLGRFVYFGQFNGNLGFWPTGDEATIVVSKAPARRNDRSALRPGALKTSAREHLVAPFLRVSNWTYIPEWRRSFGSDGFSHKTIFTLSEDGRYCSFAQAFAVEGNNPFVPQVSLKHQKMYVPNAEEQKLGVYLLTREGRFTSIPKFASIDPVKLACLDDQNDRLYIAQPNGLLSIYALDADGNPASEPQRFDLQAGEVKDMVVSPKGVLYLACATPPGGKA
jgi:hypothetical protein